MKKQKATKGMLFASSGGILSAIILIILEVIALYKGFFISTEVDFAYAVGIALTMPILTFFALWWIFVSLGFALHLGPGGSRPTEGVQEYLSHLGRLMAFAGFVNLLIICVLYIELILLGAINTPLSIALTIICIGMGLAAVWHRLDGPVFKDITFSIFGIVVMLIIMTIAFKGMLVPLTDLTSQSNELSPESVRNSDWSSLFATIANIIMFVLLVGVFLAKNMSGTKKVTVFIALSILWIVGYKALHQYDISSLVSTINPENLSNSSDFLVDVDKVTVAIIFFGFLVALRLVSVVNFSFQSWPTWIVVVALTIFLSWLMLGARPYISQTFFDKGGETTVQNQKPITGFTFNIDLTRERLLESVDNGRNGFVVQLPPGEYAITCKGTYTSQNAIKGIYPTVGCGGFHNTNISNNDLLVKDNTYTGGLIWGTDSIEWAKVGPHGTYLKRFLGGNFYITLNYPQEKEAFEINGFLAVKIQKVID